MARKEEIYKTTSPYPEQGNSYTTQVYLPVEQNDCLKIIREQRINREVPPEM
jgi:hypothetical protein